MVDDPNLGHTDDYLSEDDASGTLNVDTDLMGATGEEPDDDEARG